SYISLYTCAYHQSSISYTYDVITPLRVLMASTTCCASVLGQRGSCPPANSSNGALTRSMKFIGERSSNSVLFFTGSPMVARSDCCNTGSSLSISVNQFTKGTIDTPATQTSGALVTPIMVMYPP